MEPLKRWARALFQHAKRTLLVGSTDAREEGFDLARAFAILGMVFINFPYMLARREGVDGASAALAWVVHIPSGRASSLFVTLAGVGVSMLARRAYRSGDWRERLRAIRTLLLRAACLLPGGVLLHDVWNIDILHFYGVYLTLAALFFVFAPTLVLVLSAFVLISVGVLLDVLPLSIPEAPFLSPLGFLVDSFIDGVHPVFPWLSFLLYGLWLGRQDLKNVAWRRRMMATALALFGVLELSSIGLTSLLLLQPVAALSEHVGLFGTSWTPDPLYVLSACCTATFVIMLSHELLAFAHSQHKAAWLRPLISTGQMALTIYVTHALVGVVIPVRLGYGRDMSIELVAAYAGAFLFCVVVAATVYRLLFARGPLEWVMRMVSTLPALPLSPAEGSVSPAEGSVSPAQGSVSPAQSSVSPEQGSVSPEQGSVSPEQGAVSPEQGSVSPEQGTVSPEQGSVSPAQGPVSPAQGPVSAARAPIPMERAPVSGVQAPVAAAQAPISTAQWPSDMTTRALALAGVVLACLVFSARILGGPRASAPLRVGTTLSSLSLTHTRDFHKLTLARAAHVTLDTRSGLDLYLELREGDRWIAEDDDSGAGLDAHIEADLQPGTYAITVRPFAATTGTYALDVAVD